MLLDAALVIAVTFNPILITSGGLLAGLLLWRRSEGVRHRDRVVRALLAVLGLYAAVDGAFAYRRVAYASELTETPRIFRRIATPKSVVQVDIPCDVRCMDRIVAGLHREVFVVSTIPEPSGAKQATRRYTVVRAKPDACPEDDDEEIGSSWSERQLTSWHLQGICPTIEAAEAPKDGVFVVHDAWSVLSDAKARSFSPAMLKTRPPGAAVDFAATEVQVRKGKDVEVLGRRGRYVAPGFLLPMVGCWKRPDQVDATMPPGDLGCGLWRTLASNGEGDRDGDIGAWAYAKLFF